MKPESIKSESTTPVKSITPIKENKNLSVRELLAKLVDDKENKEKRTTTKKKKKKDRKSVV